jgi:hypothetical protein
MFELIITSAVSIIVSLGGSFVFFKEKRKDIEVDTLNKVIETLQEENKNKKEDLDKKDALIDKLYADNAVFRDKNNALIYQNALLLFNKCTVNHCNRRTPPREFSEENEEINNIQK